jgi:putative ABC transport system permease protein
MQNTWLDVRYAIRTLVRSRTFAGAVILSMAVGIGANTAVFSVFNAVLLRPFPYPNQDELVSIYETDPKRGIRRFTISPPDFLDWRRSATTLRSAAAYRSWTPNLTGVENAERLNGLRVSGDFFPLLGLEFAAGRPFDRADEDANSRTIAISETLWRRLFGGDPAAVGRALQLDGVAHTITGVVPAAIQFPDRQIDVWAPLNLDRERDQRGEHSLLVIGRVRDSRALPQVRAELGALSAPHESESGGHAPEVALLRDWFVGGSSRTTLWVLLGAVSLLLVVACGNVANLLLAHSSGRARELTVRTAIGASRARLVRQLVTESLVIAVVAGAIGFILALWTIDALVAMLPPGSPYRMSPIAIDWRVIGYAAAMSVAAGLAFGVIPAARYSRPDLSAGRYSAQFTSSFRTQTALLVAQATIATTLLAGAGVLGKAFLGIWRIDPGFSADHVVTARVTLPNRQPPAERAAFFQQVLQRLADDRDITAAAAVTHAPSSGEGNSGFLTIEGRESLSGNPATQPGAARLIATSAYFRVLGIAVRQGRVFSDADSAEATPVVVINEALMRQYWPDGNVVGRRIKRGTLPAPFPWLTIVGVVADVRQQGLGAAAVPTFYLHLPQSEEPSLTLLVKSELSNAAVAARIRSAVRAVNRNQPVALVRPLEDLVFGSVSARWLPTLWMSLFAGLALLLAAVGIYGVVSYAVEQRRREFGIRLALGAGRSAIIRLAVRQGVIPALIGTVLGCAASILLIKINTAVFASASLDPVTSAAAAALLIGLSVAASYAPARRVAETDAALTLRTE